MILGISGGMMAGMVVGDYAADVLNLSKDLFVDPSRLILTTGIGVAGGTTGLFTGLGLWAEHYNQIVIL